MQPPLVREVINLLEKEGYELANCKGSHRQFKKGNRKVTVPGKLNDHLKIGTWKSIKNQAGW